MWLVHAQFTPTVGLDTDPTQNGSPGEPPTQGCIRTAVGEVDGVRDGAGDAGGLVDGDCDGDLEAGAEGDMDAEGVADAEGNGDGDVDGDVDTDCEGDGDGDEEGEKERGVPPPPPGTLPRHLLYPLPTATRTPATQRPPGQKEWRGRGRNRAGGKGRTKEGNSTGQTALAENGAERRRRTRKGKTGKNHCGC